MSFRPKQNTLLFSSLKGFNLIHHLHRRRHEPPEPPPLTELCHRPKHHVRSSRSLQFPQHRPKTHRSTTGTLRIRRLRRTTEASLNPEETGVQAPRTPSIVQENGAEAQQRHQRLFQPLPQRIPRLSRLSPRPILGAREPTFSA